MQIMVFIINLSKSSLTDYYLTFLRMFKNVIKGSSFLSIEQQTSGVDLALLLVDTLQKSGFNVNQEYLGKSSASQFQLLSSRKCTRMGDYHPHLTCVNRTVKVYWSQEEKSIDRKKVKVTVFLSFQNELKTSLWRFSHRMLEYVEKPGLTND